MIGGMEIHIHGKSSHWCEAEQGIDAIYGASVAAKAIHELNREYKGSGKALIGIGSIHGGEYANIIADHVVMKGNIRACKAVSYTHLVQKYLFFSFENFTYLIDRKDKMWKDREEDIRTELL